MKTSSDPREWYRQEEIARDRLRQRMPGNSRSRANLLPMYLLAGAIAVGVLCLLIATDVLPMG